MARTKASDNKPDAGVDGVLWPCMVSLSDLERDDGKIRSSNNGGVPTTAIYS